MRSPPRIGRAARAAMIEHPLDPATTMVRVNEAGSADFAEDLAALAKTPYRMVMLPKASSSEPARCA